LCICVAGALGTGARYLVGVWAGKTFGAAWPYGTLIVNVIGCFLIAVVAQIAMTTTMITPTLRLTLTTGFIGGLTTYSSFNLETTYLLQERAWVSGFANLIVTGVGCFLAGLLGFVVARRLLGS
jgi:CrcB protein